MKKLILGLILTSTCVFAFKNSDEYINEINSKQNLWKAGRNFHKDMTISQLRGLLGTERVLRKFPIRKQKITEAIPKSFDARTQWPKCKIIREIVDQSACKASWVNISSFFSYNFEILQ